MSMQSLFIHLDNVLTENNSSIVIDVNEFRQITNLHNYPWTRHWVNRLAFNIASEQKYIASVETMLNIETTQETRVYLVVALTIEDYYERINFLRTEATKEMGGTIIGRHINKYKQ